MFCKMPANLGLGDDETATELFREAERVDDEAGVIHHYQIDLTNNWQCVLYRRDHFTAISYDQRALGPAREIKDPVSIKKWTRNTNLAYATSDTLWTKPISSIA
jgi:hypothetical protein